MTKTVREAAAPCARCGSVGAQASYRAKLCVVCRDTHHWCAHGQHVVERRTGWRSRICGPCAVLQQSGNRRSLMNLLRSIKLTAGCTDCGYDKHSEALDFDHMPGAEKSFDVARAYGDYGAARLLAEIAKYTCAGRSRGRPRSACLDVSNE